MWNWSLHTSRYRLAWVPVPLFMAAILVLSLTVRDTLHESPYLLTGLNILFLTTTSLFTAYAIGRSFLASGAPGLLLLGCGMAVSGAAGLVGAVAGLTSGTGHFDANTLVTIHNSCIWFSAVCHLGGTATAARITGVMPRRTLCLATAYATAFVVVTFITITSVSGETPTFFIPGQGGTEVRQFIVASAIAMFVISAFLLRAIGTPKVSGFCHYYSLGLLLFAVGLFGVLLQTVNGSLLGWVSRSSQYIGGAYLMYAALILPKRSIPSPLGSALPRGWQQQVANIGIAAGIVFSSAIIRLIFLHPLKTSVPYVTFFPAVMVAALYGGLGAGITATALSTFVAAYFWIHPTFSLIINDPADMIGIVIFFGNGIMISGITEMLQIARKRAATAENEARLAVEREHAAQALREKDKLLRTIIDNSPDPIFLKDHDGRMLIANAATLAGLGKSAIEVLGKTDLEVHGDPEIVRVIRANDLLVLNSDRAQVLEEQVMTPKGLRTFLATKAPYHDSAGRPVGLIGIARDVTAQKETEREIIEYQEQLRQMASEMSRVEEQERRRIATILHDEIGQVLILIKLKLDSMRSAETDTGRKQEIMEIGEFLKQTIGFTRSLTNELIPPLLYEVGLHAAIESLCDDYANRYGLSVTCHSSGRRLPFETQQVILFKAVRELLINIVKHARARNVTVTLDFEDDSIGIRVEDDGVGVEAAKLESSAGAGGFGLFNLRERVLYSGGSFSVDTGPNQGTRVSLRLPKNEETSRFVATGSSAAPGAEASPVPVTTAPRR